MPLVVRSAERQLASTASTASTGSVVDEVFSKLRIAPPRPERTPPTGSLAESAPSQKRDRMDAFKREWARVIEQGYL